MTRLIPFNTWTSRSARAAIMVAVVAVAVPVGLFAAEEPRTEAEGSVDPAPDSSATDDRELASRILSSLAEASQRLEDGAVDSSTIALQQSAADDIEALLANLRDNSRPSSSQQSGDSPSRQDSAQPSGRSSGRPNENRDAAQSNEQARDGSSANPEDEVQRRRNLAHSVWGHLPPKVQEELERSFSERFAPKYEELIRRYYEALAERPRRTP
jgi:hypothetical protein